MFRGPFRSVYLALAFDDFTTRSQPIQETEYTLAERSTTINAITPLIPPSHDADAASTCIHI